MFPNPANSAASGSNLQPWCQPNDIGPLSSSCGPSAISTRIMSHPQDSHNCHYPFQVGVIPAALNKYEHQISPSLTGLLTNTDLCEILCMSAEFLPKRITKLTKMILTLPFDYVNPVYGVASICHQVRCLPWGHPSLIQPRLFWFDIKCSPWEIYDTDIYGWNL